MTNRFAIEKNIASFQDLQDRLGLVRTSDDRFFEECQTLHPEPSLDRKLFLDALHKRHAYYYNAGLLTEGTILVAIVAPLLENLGFHEPPFFVRSEVPVALEVTERDEIYRGRIDVLVIRQRLWVLVVEAKNAKFAADLALPQCLSYMAASSEPTTFGLVTNGTDFIFCKRVNTTYDFSEPFSLLSRHNRLYEIAGLLSTLKASTL
ncbi:MAG: type I restriction endonuclease [Prochlorotrichaceae cyanobacterium]